MTVELVSTDRIAHVCSYCGTLIRHIPAYRQVKVEQMASHGICPSCLPAVEERYFGKRRATA